MSGKEEYKVFVGGLAWDITERQLENAFDRFGKIVSCQMPDPVLQVLPSWRTVGYLINCECKSIENMLLKIMLERDTGRPRGFGFITFVDRRAMDDAIEQMHGREFGDRVITVNEAQPRMADDLDHGYRGGHTSGGRGGHRGGDRLAGRDDCFKCGRPGHWARDCPSAGGRSGTGGSFSSRSRFGGTDVRGDRFGERDRFIDDRYDGGGRFGDQDRFDSRETRYGTRDRYQPPTGDRFASDRYGASDRYLQNGYGKDRGYDREVGPRGNGDRYGSGGPARNDRGYRSRPDPYARPPVGGRPSSFDRY